MKPEIESSKTGTLYYFVRHRSLSSSDTYGQVIAVKDQKELLSLEKEGFDLIEVTKL